MVIVYVFIYLYLYLSLLFLSFINKPLNTVSRRSFVHWIFFWKIDLLGQGTARIGLIRLFYVRLSKVWLGFVNVSCLKTERRRFEFQRFVLESLKRRQSWKYILDNFFHFFYHHIGMRLFSFFLFFLLQSLIKIKNVIHLTESSNCYWDSVETTTKVSKS